MALGNVITRGKVLGNWTRIRSVMNHRMLCGLGSEVVQKKSNFGDYCEWPKDTLHSCGLWLIRDNHLGWLLSTHYSFMKYNPKSLEQQ